MSTEPVVPPTEAEARAAIAGRLVSLLKKATELYMESDDPRSGVDYTAEYLAANCVSIHAPECELPFGHVGECRAHVGAALPAEHAPPDPSRVRDVIAGLEIFQRNGSKSVNAEHDVVYAGPSTKDALNETDRDALRVAGWFWDEEVESWGIFV